MGNIFQNIIDESKASLEKLDLEKAIPLIAQTDPKIIVEIGMWKGFSADVWIKAFNPELLITLEQDHKHEDGSYREYNVEGVKKYHYLWDVNSNSEITVDRVKELLGGKEIDFLFIDGGHTYPVIRQDIELFFPLVKEGGVIGFHDILYFSDACQVSPHWQKLKREYDYIEINCGPGSTGFGLIYKNKMDNKIINYLHI